MPRPPPGACRRAVSAAPDGRRPCALGVRFAGALRVGQPFQVLAGEGRGPRGSERAAALRNRAVEQSFGQRRRAQHADRDSAGRFAEDRHLAGIAAECGDVPLHPLETRDHVQQAVVARDMVRRLGAQLRVRQESELPDAVGDADQHHALLGQLLPAVVRLGGGARVESAAVDPDEHGDAVARRLRRRPDVQIQAVLARSGPLTGSSGVPHPLHGPGPESVGLPHALPFRGGLRRAPSEVADGRRGEGNAPVDRQPVFESPLNHPALDPHRSRLLLRHRGPDREHRNQKSLLHVNRLPYFM